MNFPKRVTGEVYMKAFSILMLLSMITYTLVHAENPSGSRGPAVENIQEIDIEADAKVTSNKGYAFGTDKPKVVQVTKEIPKTRFPANENYDESKNGSFYIGPFLFLLVLPLTFWIVFSKKLKNNETETGKYFSKTIQFKPFETEYQKNDDDDNDDENYPKAG